MIIRGVCELLKKSAGAALIAPLDWINSTWSVFITDCYLADEPPPIKGEWIHYPLSQAAAIIIKMRVHIFPSRKRSRRTNIKIRGWADLGAFPSLCSSEWANGRSVAWPGPGNGRSVQVAARVAQRPPSAHVRRRVARARDKILTRSLCALALAKYHYARLWN